MIRFSIRRMPATVRTPSSAMTTPVSTPISTPVSTPGRTPTARRPLGDVTPNSSSHSASARKPVMSFRAFAQRREALTREVFEEVNLRVFKSRVPPDLSITWSKKLNTTAGLTYCSKKSGHFAARIELSTKVVDRIDRLRSTLSHELCHVAAWLFDETSNPPHGKAFKRWAAKVHQAFPDILVTTCHRYSIHYKFRYQCQNVDCAKEYGRHSKSINSATHGCGKCGGTLVLLGQFNQDGTPAKAKQGNSYSMFMKEHFSATKAGCDKGTPHKEVMKIMSRKWEDAKKSAAGDGSAIGLIMGSPMA